MDAMQRSHLHGRLKSARLLDTVLYRGKAFRSSYLRDKPKKLFPRPMHLTKHIKEIQKVCAAQLCIELGWPWWYLSALLQHLQLSTMHTCVRKFCHIVGLHWHPDAGIRSPESKWSPACAVWCVVPCCNLVGGRHVVQLLLTTKTTVLVCSGRMLNQTGSKQPGCCQSCRSC